MSNTYQPRHAARLCRVSPQTIRVWSIEFAQYLTPSAVSKDGKTHRNFTHSDMQVLLLIADMRRTGITYEAIHVALQNGERAPETELTPHAIDDAVQFAVALPDDAGHVIEVIKALQDRIEQLEQTVTDTVSRTAYETLELQYARERAERDAVQREIGRLQTLLDIERRKNAAGGGAGASGQLDEHDDDDMRTPNRPPRTRR